MNGDTPKNTEKVYKITEKEYVQAKRNKERLLRIKKLAGEIHSITAQIKDE